MYAREQALVSYLQAQPKTAPATIIIEGLPTGQDLLGELENPPQLIRLAPACLCCAGNMVLKVHLHRILRKRPSNSHLWIVLHDALHLPQLRAQLEAAEYIGLLQLQDDRLISS